MLPAAAPPPLVAIAHRSYRERFNDPSLDPFGGVYDAVMDEYEPTLVNAIQPADIRARVLLSADTMPHAYVSLVGDDAEGVGKIVLVHRPVRYPVSMGQPATPWDNRSFAFVGDVQGPGGHINIVEFPADAFHIAGGGQLHVPTAVVLDAAFAVGPDVASIGPYANGDAGTDVIRTRQYMYCPAKYVHLFLEHRLTPRQAWERVVGAITNDGAAVACAPLVNWIRAACTIAPNRPVPSVQRASPVVPLADVALQDHRHTIVSRDLPARTGPQEPALGSALQIASAIGALASEQREARAEVAATAAHDKTKTPEYKWGTLLGTLLRVGQVGTADDLQPVYHALASAPKKLERPTIQSHVDAAADLMGNSNAPIITASLATKIASLQFGMTDLDDLEDGVQPFSVGYRTPTSARIARTQVGDYDTLLQSNAGATLTDIQQFRDADKVTLPTEVLQVSATLRSYLLVLNVLLGANHVLTVEFEKFVHGWLLDEMALLELCVGKPMLPALVLRWLQLRIAHWFHDQAREARAIPAPDLVVLRYDLRMKSVAWYPEFPARYLAPVQYHPAPTPRAAPVPLPVQRVTSAVQRATVPAPTPSAGSAVQQMVRNTGLDPRFAPFPATGLAIRLIVERNPDSPIPTNVQGLPRCLSYHVKGSCYTTCKRAADHRPLTEADATTLFTWCQACYASADAGRA